MACLPALSAGGACFAHADRILQLVCVQTKPVQIYRITAGDALPPAGVVLDDDLDSSVVVVDGGDEVDAAAKFSGDIPVPSSSSPCPPTKVQGEAGGEAEVEVVQDDAAETEDAIVGDGGKDGRVGDVVDSVALSKEGGDGGGEGGGSGEESAPSFEKVRGQSVSVAETGEGRRGRDEM